MNINEATALKSNMHATFDSPQGKEVMLFLEKRCSWYDSVFVPTSPELTLVAAGRREVLATIKTVMKYSPKQIVALQEDS